MSLAGSRVGIVGGSIGGCAAAIALQHVGCQVTVFERSGRLADRGHGITIPEAVWTDLVENGYLDAEVPAQRCIRRLWMVPDNTLPGGRIGWEHPMPARLTNWGTMWRCLRARVPDSVYRQAVVITIEADSDGVTVGAADGGVDRFDLVVGADGYKSLVRAAIAPEESLNYAGYVMWRGTFPVGQLPPGTPAELVDGTVFVGLPQGHMGGYIIPDLAGDGWLMNWFCYASAFEETEFDETAWLPAGSVPDWLIDRLHSLMDECAPPAWRDIVRVSRRDEIAVQPIYDLVMPTYAAGRLMLIGDAGALSRPHAGAGATKTLMDALALEQGCAQHAEWDDALRAYDTERCATGNGLVALGRRLGEATVVNPPAWQAMAGHEIESWHVAAIVGTPLPYDIGINY